MDCHRHPPFWELTVYGVTLKSPLFFSLRPIFIFRSTFPCVIVSFIIA